MLQLQKVFLTPFFQEFVGLSSVQGEDIVRMHNDPKGGQSTRNAAGTKGFASVTGDARTRWIPWPFKEVTNLRLTDPARTNQHNRASDVTPGHVPGNRNDPNLSR